MNDTTAPAGVAEMRRQMLTMARHLIGVDVGFAGISTAGIERVLALKAQRWRTALELSADTLGAVTISFVAISPDGDRQMIEVIARDPLPSIN